MEHLSWLSPRFGHIFSMSGSCQVLSDSGWSGLYKRNSTSNRPQGRVSTQFDSLPAGPFGPK